MSSRLAFGWFLAIWLSYGGLTARGSGSVTNCTEAAFRVALQGGGLITLACDSTINLTAAIVISADTVIDGSGHTAALSGASATNLPHLFTVEPGTTLTLRNLSLTGSQVFAPDGTSGHEGQRAFGAAIYINGGSVTLEGCTVSDHQLTGGIGSDASQAGRAGGSGGAALGAAVFNDGGQLIVTNCVFASNSAVGGVGGEGGAGFEMGNGSKGGDGGDGGVAAGAAVYNTRDGVVAIFDSSFVSNRVSGASGGIGGAGVGFLGFPGRPGDSGEGYGGALFNASGRMAVLNSTFFANQCNGADGNPGNPGTDLIQPGNGTTGGAALGGGALNQGGSLFLTNCTFAANLVTAGAGGEGGAGRSSGFGSNGGKGGRGGDALGGGLHNASGVSVVVNCSFSGNKLTAGTGGPGGPGGGLGDEGDSGESGKATGGALYHNSGTLELKNSILAGVAAVPNVKGTVTDAGYNLSSDETPPVSGTGSRTSTDPLLGAFTPAGGLVSTLTLSSNSPAINAIGAGGNGAPTFDQRRAPRNAPFDIGAFEFAGVPAGLSLQVQKTTNQIVLSWPATAGSVLQTVTALARSTAWLSITNQITTSGATKTVALPRTNSASYYRLVAP